MRSDGRGMGLSRPGSCGAGDVVLYLTGIADGKTGGFQGQGQGFDEFLSQ
jgi:hypothetical protein